MKFNWEDFKNAYKNEQEARQAFVSLCEILMQKRYPDYSIKNSDEISENDNKKDKTLEKNCIVFLPKYFLDGVSNSRKGQIRKSLNDNLPYMKANKITQWVLLLPYTFSDEERSWWGNWSLRIKQENGVTPNVLLGNELDGFPNSIPSLVAKYQVEFKGFESIIQAEKEKRAKVVVEEDTEMLGFLGMGESAKPAETQDDEEAKLEESIVSFELPKVAAASGTVSVKIDKSEALSEQESDSKSEALTQEEQEKELEAKLLGQPSKPKNIVASTEIKIERTDSNAPKNNNAPRISESAKPETPKQEAPKQESSVKADAPKADAPKQEAPKAGVVNKVAAVKVAEPTLKQLRNTHYYKVEFEALDTEKNELPNEKGNNQRDIFDARRDKSSVKNYLNDFVFGDLSQFKGADLIKKAQIYVTNEQYSRGLYIYEYAKAKGLVDSTLENDYNRGVSESKFQLNYKYNMIKGDLLFAKGDYINAYETFKKACDVVDYYKETLKEYDNNDSTIITSSTSLMRSSESIVKYYESYGEALLQVGEFSKAVDNFEMALENDPTNESIQKRLRIAQLLEKGTTPPKAKWLSWVTVFTAPYYYFKARNMDPSIKELKNAEKLRRRAIFGVLIPIAIILGLVALWWCGRRVVEVATTDEPKVIASAPATPLTIQISKGDYYMERISPETPHFIDSAIAAYERALRIDNTDTSAEVGYQKATIARSNYITKVQQDISTDSADFFLSMRRPTEGLRLFKYKYDPNDRTKGKFGFVDTNGVVKIAPMFDFNYRTMDEQGETFYNGRAKVCLKVGENDTVYFYIDQHGNKIEE